MTAPHSSYLLLRVMCHDQKHGALRADIQGQLIRVCRFDLDNLPGIDPVLYLIVNT